MAQSLVNVGEVSDHWKAHLVLWVLAVVAVSLLLNVAFWGAFFGVAGATFAFWGARSLWWAFSSRSVEQQSVGALGGQSAAVELEGQARAIEDPLTAPLSGEDCVAYEVTVKEVVPSDDG